ncbi:pseudouridine synthase [Phaeobacter sp.]|uniref:pseudouridine synthase n=1 Tax=Phaeobacter sp. TaxID=1902409 RepID=UPI0025CBFCB2|nr:pseudouridine synthase [Phaeobacter sp.]
MSKTPSSPAGPGARPGKPAHSGKPSRNRKSGPELKSSPVRKAAADPAASGTSPAGDRIAKVLSRSGVASRREAERMIAEGRVEVNGVVIDSPALNVVLGKDRINVDGAPLQAPEPPRLWLYHKPAGLVTTTSDELDRKTIFDELPEDLPRVMTVGRLDLNSEGLLLLTNDGGIKRQLELPSTGWLRRYRVRINGRPQDSDFAPLRKGLVIDGERFQPMIVTLDRQQGANAWLTVGLREGKNREIRRAMEDIGFNVNRLLRVSYGPFQLGQLKQGEVEELRPRVVRDQLGLEHPEDTAAPAAGQRTRPTRGKPGGKPGGKMSGKSGSRVGGRAGNPDRPHTDGRKTGAPGSGRFGPGKSAPGKSAPGKSAPGKAAPDRKGRPSGKSFGGGADGGKRGANSRPGSGPARGGSTGGARGPGKPPRR